MARGASLHFRYPCVCALTLCCACCALAAVFNCSSNVVNSGQELISTLLTFAESQPTGSGTYIHLERNITLQV